MKVGRKEQPKKVTGSLYLGREKFRESCWPHRSTQGSLLGALRARVGLRGAAPLNSDFTILTLWIWTKLSWRGSELTIPGIMQTALEAPLARLLRHSPSQIGGLSDHRFPPSLSSRAFPCVFLLVRHTDEDRPVMTPITIQQTWAEHLLCARRCPRGSTPGGGR